MCPERSRKWFSSLCRYYEARTSLFKSQEKSINLFSALCRCCEARASLFKRQERSGKQFSSLLRSCEARTILIICGKGLRKTVSTAVEAL